MGLQMKPKPNPVEIREFDIPVLCANANDLRDGLNLDSIYSEILSLSSSEVTFALRVARAD